MKYIIATLGCKVNQYESEAMEQLLQSHGHTPCAEGESADAVIVNTCAVTAEGARKARQTVRRLRRENPDALTALCGCWSQVDAAEAASLGADVLFGTGDRPKDFLHFYLGTFIGGGLVMNGQLFLGRTGNAAGVGPMLVSGPDGRLLRLLEVASLNVLAESMETAGESSDHIWEQHQHWQVSRPLLDRWLASAARGLAHATLNAAALVEIEAVILDGWMPVSVRAELVQATEAAFKALDLAGVDPPAIREGTVGADARALGAAAIPLSHRYLIDQNAPVRQG